MRISSPLLFLAAFVFSSSLVTAQIPQSLPFRQDWTNISLITADDNWSGVPGMIGHRGDGLTTAPGVDPQTVLADGSLTPIDVNANRTAPNTFTTGGIAEFHLANPTIALQGSGTADAPFIRISVNTTGQTNIRVSYKLRDIDGSADNAVQQIALQYRVGAVGSFINIPAAFVADATEGPNLDTKVTPVSIVLPVDAENRPVVHIRIITADASGSDEWVGIDDIVIGAQDLLVEGTANPSTVESGGSTLLTAKVTPATGPPSTGIVVTGDLSSIGGLMSQPFFDDGTNGDMAAGDNTFSYGATVAAGTAPGMKTLPLQASDGEGRTASATIGLTVVSPSEPTLVVISQLYGGGGNTGALFTNDFIELFNRGTSPVDLTGWSVQYASSSGTTWQVTALSGTIQPGRYYLVQEAAGAGGSVSLPPPDATGTIMMAAGSAKVALVNNSVPLTGSCPTPSPSVVDFVGYGMANCFEGGGSAPTLSNTTAALRRQGGCTDTDHNAADFFSGAPNPRNSSAPFNDCNTPPPDPIAIHVIQGSGSTSPFAGQIVATIPSIVTGLKSNGFFIQAPDGAGDGNPNTSEGIFVFTGSGVGTLIPGDVVTVTGTVAEFIPSVDPFSPPLTELSGVTFTRLSAGSPLPLPLEITSAEASPSGSIEQLERFEGMRVSVQSLTVCGPTLGSINESNASSTSNGVFYGVVTGIPRPFREPGIERPFPVPPSAPSAPIFDANPERLRVDSDGQPGAAIIDVTAGATVSNLVGPLDYSFRTYTILPDPGTPPTVSGNVSATPVTDPSAGEITVATYNMQRFFDAVNDPAIGDPVLNMTAFNNRLNKVSLTIRDQMKTPDIIGAVEVENLSTLQVIASKVNADAVAAGAPSPAYEAYLMEGNDVGGIDVGFLVKTTRVTVIDVTQEGKATTFINPLNGQPELLNDRPPLILRAEVHRPSTPPFPLTAIVVHQRSLNGVDDPVDGPRVREKRKAQAEFLANLIQARQSANPNEHIVSVGDYNAFQFNDGYVDVIGTVLGTPTPPGSVATASPDLVDPNLVDLVDLAPADQRYSFVFDGNAQELDHIIVNQALLSRISRVEYARVNADFPDVFRNDAGRPERLSDHDPAVAYVTLPPQNNPPVAVAGEDQAIECVGHEGTQATLDASGSSDADGDSLVYTWRENGVVVAGPSGDPVAAVSLSLGSHVFELTVDDLKGGTDTDTVVVQIVDTVPPEITVVLDPAVLWPPNHLLTEISATVTMTDSCDENPTFVLVSVSSNQPDIGRGDGDRPNDIQEAAFGTSDIQFKLRAERAGGGRGGRVYTVVYQATDASGNTSSDTTMVQVPHDMSSGNAAGPLAMFEEIPTEFSVDQNYPNPFNPSTVFRFGLPKAASVTLKVYNLIGQQVAVVIDRELKAGFHSVEWNAEALPSGIYIYRLVVPDPAEGSTKNLVETRKLVLIK